MAEERVPFEVHISSNTAAEPSAAVDKSALLDQTAGFGAVRSEEESDVGALLASLQPREFLALEPGEPARVVSSPHHIEKTAIYLSEQEIVFHDGIRVFRCRVPATDDPGLAKLPLASKVVVVVIHHRPVGPGAARNLYALDATGTAIAKVDDTGTWEFRLDLLEEACERIGLDYERMSFERVDELLDSFPNLAEPHLEFEEHHPVEEDVRELSMGVFYGGALAVGLLGSTGMVLVLVNPVGDFYRGLLAVGCVVMCALTWWSASKRRMRRSMRQAHSKALRHPSERTSR